MMPKTTTPSSSVQTSSTGNPAFDEILASCSSSSSLSNSSSVSDTLSNSLPHFTSFHERLQPITHHLHHYAHHPTISPISTVLDSLSTSLHLQLSKITDGSSPVSLKSLENCAHEIARSLGMLLVVWNDAPSEIRDGMKMLYGDMMALRVNGLKVEIVGGGVVGVDLEDVVIRVKKGEDEENRLALLELGLLIGNGMVGEEESGDVIAVLLNRLGAGKIGERLRIIVLLRRLAEKSDENKVTIVI